MGLGWLFSGACRVRVTRRPLAVAAGAATVVALHFVRLRRRGCRSRSRRCGWAGAERASRCGTRRLRHWLSLMLALVVLAAPAARPSIRNAARRRSVRPQLGLPDRSVGVDVGDRRAGLAPGRRAGARAGTGRGLGPADRALVASFAAEATAESGFESDSAALGRAIAARRPPATSRAICRARWPLPPRCCAAGPRPTVVLVSDGGFTPTRAASRGDRAGTRPPLRARRAARRQRRHPVAGGAAQSRPIPAPSRPGWSCRTSATRPRASASRSPAAARSSNRLTLDAGAGRAAAVTLADLFAPDARIEARLAARRRSGRRRSRGGDIPPLPRRRVLRVGGADLYLDGALLEPGADDHRRSRCRRPTPTARWRARALRPRHLRRRDAGRAAHRGALPLLRPAGTRQPARVPRARARSDARPGHPPPRAPAVAPARPDRRQHRRGAPPGAGGRRRGAGRLVRRRR